MKGLTVLGSTGSVGLSTLDVVLRNPGEFRVHALSARTNHARMHEQCLMFQPRYAVMLEEQAAEILSQSLARETCETEVLCGAQALETISSLPEVDAVMAAIVGGAGLLPTLAAAKSGKQVLLANKESLVMSGQVLMDAVRDNGAQLLPIDSEHNAIFQCMPGNFSNGFANVGVERLLLTASGGPFLSRSPAQLHDVTPDEACSHPTWDMGRKISVDSASMMNKGLEVIEACWLFGTDSSHIEVVIHPQSVIHSMVQYCDGSTLAQLGNPDMRTPIAHALFWPERGCSGVGRLDLLSIASLSFAEPDLQQFPCLRLCYEAAEAAGSATTTLNGANEVAVQAFLNGQIRFTDIVGVIEKTLETAGVGAADSIGLVLEADTLARHVADEMVAKLKTAA